MKRFLTALFATIISCIVFSDYATAQRYIVSSPARNHTTARPQGEDRTGTMAFFSKNKGEAFDIPNGETVTVVGASFDYEKIREYYKEETKLLTYHKPLNFMAYIDYNGKLYEVPARDLLFAEDNPAGTIDRLDIDYSPSYLYSWFKGEGGRLNTSFDKLMYSWLIPVSILLLSIIGIIIGLLGHSGKLPTFIAIILLSAVVLLTAAIEFGYVALMGSECMWWCAVEIFSKMGAVWRMSMLVVVLGLQFFAFSQFRSLVESKAGYPPSIGMSILGHVVTAVAFVGILIYIDQKYQHLITPDGIAGYSNGEAAAAVFFVSFAAGLIVPMIYNWFRMGFWYGTFGTIFMNVYTTLLMPLTIAIIVAAFSILLAIVLPFVGVVMFIVVFFTNAYLDRSAPVYKTVSDANGNAKFVVDEDATQAKIDSYKGKGFWEL